MIRLSGYIWLCSRPRILIRQHRVPPGCFSVGHPKWRRNWPKRPLRSSSTRSMAIARPCPGKRRPALQSHGALGLGRRAPGGCLARNGAAGRHARHCREAAQVADEAAQSRVTARCRQAANCRAGRARLAQAPLKRDKTGAKRHRALGCCLRAIFRKSATRCSGSCQIVTKLAMDKSVPWCFIAAPC
ncbi:hypothetical protein ABIF69_004584 [Bradyrhizobium japonicum]